MLKSPATAMEGATCSAPVGEIPVAVRRLRPSQGAVRPQGGLQDPCLAVHFDELLALLGILTQACLHRHSAQAGASGPDPLGNGDLGQNST